MVGPLDLCSFPRHPPCNREGVPGLPQMETSSGSSEMLFHSTCLTTRHTVLGPVPSPLLISPIGKTSQNTAPPHLPPRSSSWSPNCFLVGNMRHQGNRMLGG